MKYLISFLGFLSQVASSSTAARISLYENQNLRALESLSMLLDCPVASPLKAALFASIGAFCKPQFHASGSSVVLDAQQAEILSNVWLMLETHQVVSMKNGRFVREGIVFDLEEREAADQIYPETLVRLPPNFICLGLFDATEGFAWIHVE